MNEHYYNIDLERCEITPLGKHPNWHSANEKFEADCRDNFCWIERAKSLRNLRTSIEKHLGQDGEMSEELDIMSEEIQQLQAEIVDLKDELFDEQFKLSELEDIHIPFVLDKLMELRDEILPHWSTRDAQMTVSDIIREIEQWRT